MLHSASPKMAAAANAQRMCGNGLMRPVPLARFATRPFQSSGTSKRAASLATAGAVAESARPVLKREDIITSDPANNVTDYIYEKMGVNLHHKPDHPIGIIKQAIYDYFEARAPGTFAKLDDLYPVVSTTANFDEVLVPSDHVSRNPNDTYYVASDKVLRCHTSAHQAETLRSGEW